jgi:hypothetical protein
MIAKMMHPVRLVRDLPGRNRDGECDSISVGMRLIYDKADRTPSFPTGVSQWSVKSLDFVDPDRLEYDRLHIMGFLHLHP